ncbi:hypothetical protein [Nocardia gipuzkoensis]
MAEIAPVIIDQRFGYHILLVSVTESSIAGRRGISMNQSGRQNARLSSIICETLFDNNSDCRELGNRFRHTTFPPSTSRRTHDAASATVDSREEVCGPNGMATIDAFQYEYIEGWKRAQVSGPKTLSGPDSYREARSARPAATHAEIACTAV